MRGKPMPEDIRRDLGLVEPATRAGANTAPTVSAAELMETDLGEVRWAVPGILPEGLTILGGKPKMGKSWLALGVGIAVASGGHALGKVRVDRGDVLYLALEDNRRRLQRRLRKLLQGSAAPAGLDLALEWERVGEGFEERLVGWLEAHPDAKMVIIDTLKRIRPNAHGNRSLYDVDYEALAPLIPIAARYGVSLLVIHHLRKSVADDPLDELSSSTGLTAVIDGALILKRDRGKAAAYLHVTGRDVEDDRELALAWDQELAAWTLVGDAEEYRRSAEQQRILELLRGADGPMGPKDVSEALDLPHGSVRVIMPKMVREGLLENPGHGKYSPTPSTSINTINTVNSSNSINSPNTSGRGPKGGGNPATVNGVNDTVSGAGTVKPHSYQPPEASVNTVNGVNKGSQDDGGIYPRQTPLTSNPIGENKPGGGNRSRQAAEESDVGGLVRELLDDPPNWLTGQLVKYRSAPERLAEPTCAAIAAYLGIPARAAETRPHLEAFLAEQGAPRRSRGV
jgi:hypothetical protein